MTYNIISEPPGGGGSWEEDAACRDHDSSLWILSEDPKDRQKNKDNFERAEVICSKCPVITQCWQSSTGTDRKVTMRSGAWPIEYVEPTAAPGFCRNGHDVTLPNGKTTEGKCRECKNASKRRYSRRVAEQRKAV